MTWVTGDAMNLIAAGEFQLCKDCDLDEEKQTNVSEQPMDRHKFNGERYFIDIC